MGDFRWGFQQWEPRGEVDDSWVHPGTGRLVVDYRGIGGRSDTYDDGEGSAARTGVDGELRTVVTPQGSFSHRKMRIGLSSKLQSCVEKARASTGADRFSEDECVVGGKRSVWGDTLGARLSARFEEGWHQLWGSANIGLKGISI